MMPANCSNVTNGTFLVEGVIRPALAIQMLPINSHEVINFTWECLNYTQT